MLFMRTLYAFRSTLITFRGKSFPMRVFFTLMRFAHLLPCFIWNGFASIVNIGMDFWRNQFEILWSIIQSIAVDMVNKLETFKRSAKFLFHYVTVNQKMSTVDANVPIFGVHKFIWNWLARMTSTFSAFGSYAVFTFFGRTKSIKRKFSFADSTNWHCNLLKRSRLFRGLYLSRVRHIYGKAVMINKNMANTLDRKNYIT